MDRLELVRLAIQELGDVSAQELAAHVEQKHGLKIDPKFLPVYKASLRDRLNRSNDKECPLAGSINRHPPLPGE